MAEEVEPKKVIIDDVEYELEKLSENARAQLVGIQLANNEMKRLTNLLALAETARNAYAKVLSDDLPEKE
jgi:hypothetical protein|tara:strand:- start:163 stop:372 length:210 start_codon:yes stop_codon:yes gene_type:complete